MPLWPTVEWNTSTATPQPIITLLCHFFFYYSFWYHPLFTDFGHYHPTTISTSRFLPFQPYLSSSSTCTNLRMLRTQQQTTQSMFLQDDLQETAKNFVQLIFSLLRNHQSKKIVKNFTPSPRKIKKVQKEIKFIDSPFHIAIRRNHQDSICKHPNPLRHHSFFVYLGL